MQEKRRRINPTTHKHSVDLRRNATKPEQILWNALRSRQLAGRKFRKQHSIEHYIVDFYCAEAKLVIEVDGESHEGRGGYDANRQARLEELGYHVLRFTNNDVIDNLEGVAERISRVALEITSSPSPDPSLKGRGNSAR